VSDEHTTPVLILGGTAEARALATALVGAGRPVISSLAGRVRDPALPLGEVRIGGFSTATLTGAEGLAAYLSEHHVGAVVDATHPFAATISANAVDATARAGPPLLRLQRPGWRDHPDADRWTWVDSVDEAVSAGAGARRPFLTTGRQSLDRFLPWADQDVTVRVVDPPEFALPERWRLVRSRGPYAYASERALLTEAGTDLLVTKDSGGTHTAAKLDAARDLGVRVLVIERPASPAGVPVVGSVAASLTWLQRQVGFTVSHPVRGR
jgi:precorrin-6A/cobalt-precorrin-6A reductase